MSTHSTTEIKCYIRKKDGGKHTPRNRPTHTLDFSRDILYRQPRLFLQLIFLDFWLSFLSLDECKSNSTPQYKRNLGLVTGCRFFLFDVRTLDFSRSSISVSLFLLADAFCPTVPRSRWDSSLRRHHVVRRKRYGIYSIQRLRDSSSRKSTDKHEEWRVKAEPTRGTSVN